MVLMRLFVWSGNNNFKVLNYFLCKCNNNDFNNYSLYINDYGKLYISYLVKTTQVDYNEVMEVN